MTDNSVSLNEINSKLQSLIEINETLVKQNIKLSEALLGKVKEPEDNSPPKKLYYHRDNSEENIYLIHGPGTYDNKSKLKEELGAEWQGQTKSWRVIRPLDEILSKFPSMELQSL
jgi:hypothetical protein